MYTFSSGHRFTIWLVYCIPEQDTFAVRQPRYVCVGDTIPDSISDDLGKPVRIRKPVWNPVTVFFGECFFVCESVPEPN